MKAAEQGQAEAQYYVGLFYQEGLVVSKNLTTALQWFEKAAAQGHQEAAKAVRGIR